MIRFADLARILLFSLPVLLIGCGGGSSPTPTYSLGGSITGLTTAGLVLANGSDTVSPASGATSFTFATQVAAGATYAVSVQVQPTNSTCTIANGSGTIAAAAVTSVQVTCALNSFQIGGTISGLTATGLVLANGADTVSPASGATSFVFGTRVTVGNSYGVTIKTQPAGLNCTLANAGGTATANVGNVAVTCTVVPVAGWSGATVVGTGNYPQLANDPSGVAFFLGWCTCTGAVGELTTGMASRYTDAGGWTTPAATTSTLAGVRTPLMQFDAQGRGFGVWSAPTGNNDGSVNPMWSRYIPGSGWGSGPMPFAVMLPPVVAPPNSTLFSSFIPLGVSVAADGTASAVIQEAVNVSSGGNESLSYIAGLIAGAVPGVNFLQIGAADLLFPASDSSPVNAPNGSGGTIPIFPNVTSWLFDPVTPSTLPVHFATLYRSTATLPMTLGNGTAGFDTVTTYGLAMNTSAASGGAITLFVDDLLGENPLARGVYRLGVTKASTAIAANGDALTAWSVIADDFSGVTIFAQRFVGGAWLASQVIYTSSNQLGDYNSFKFLPVSALNSAGNGMIAFNSRGTLMAVKMNSAGVFTPATPIAAGAAATSLQMDGAGNAFLLDYDGASSGSVRRYDAATDKWAAPGITFATNYVSPPLLALDAQGNAMVAWGNAGAILASRYR